MFIPIFDRIGHFLAKNYRKKFGVKLQNHYNPKNKGVKIPHIYEKKAEKTKK